MEHPATSPWMATQKSVSPASVTKNHPCKAYKYILRNFLIYDNQAFIVNKFSHFKNVFHNTDE